MSENTTNLKDFKQRSDRIDQRFDIGKINRGLRHSRKSTASLSLFDCLPQTLNGSANVVFSQARY